MSAMEKKTDLTTKELVCAACGKSEHADGKKLKQCAACKSVRYCDVNCQRSHRKAHRKECKRIEKELKAAAVAAASAADAPADGNDDSDLLARQVASCSITNAGVKKNESENPSICYSVTRRPNRGRCMIANRPIAKGTRLSEETSSSSGVHEASSFRPLVPPVLMANVRKQRCSNCFARLSMDTQDAFVLDGPPAEMRPLQHHFCSARCLSLCEESALAEEIAAYQVVRRDTDIRPSSIGPTALLLYRILKKMVSYMNTNVDPWNISSDLPAEIDFLSELESHYESIDSTGDEGNFVKTTATVSGLLLMSSGDRISPEIMSNVMTDTKTYLQPAVSKISTNAFTICDGEGESIGLGLYPTAAAINHSCSPNLIQTFMYGKDGLPPSLLLTTSQPVAMGEELCIAYTDIAAPTRLRNELLQKGYKFTCNCHRCQVSLDDDVTKGIFCPREGCQGLGRKVLHTASYECDTCGHVDFTETLKRRDEAFGVIQAFTDLLGKTGRTAKLDISAAERKQQFISTTRQLPFAYDTLKRICTPDSWYVQEAGEAVARMTLDQIDFVGPDGSYRNLCAAALTVLKEIGSQEDKQTSKYCPLPSLLRRYKVAKLELVLFQDPRPAILALQNLRTDLLVYFPCDHELIRMLEDDMRRGMA